MSFDLIATPRFEKRFLKIANKKLQKKVALEIHTLKNDPFGVTRMSNIKKLKGTKNTYRLRVDDYRIFYEINKTKKETVLLTVEHRKDCY